MKTRGNKSSDVYIIIGYANNMLQIDEDFND